MNLFDQYKESFYNRLPDKPKPEHVFHYVLPGKHAGITVTHENSLTFSAVFSAVRLISETLAYLPFHVMQQLSNGTKERVENSRIERLIRLRANPETPASILKETLTAWAMTWGNGYAAIERDSGGRAIALWPAAPDRVRPLRAPDTSLIYEVRNTRSEVSYVPQMDMIHIHGLGYNGVEGYSVISLAAESLGAGLASQRFTSSFYGNHAQPGVALKYPHPMDDETYERVKKSWNESHGGPANAWKPVILENGMELQSMGMPLKDAEYLSTREFQVTEVARWFRIPPHKIYDLTRSTYCLPAGSQVFTEHGPKPIETIEKGERVWSLAENQEFRLARVNAATCSGEDQIYTIKTTNRTLRANGRHRVLVRRKHPAPKTGIGGYQSIEWRNEYIPVNQLKRGDTLVTLKALPAEGNTHTPSGRRSLEFMEFCGLLLGDGNVYKNWGVKIARHKDASYMPHYLDVMRAEFRKYDGGNGRGNVVVKMAPVHIQQRERYCSFASVVSAIELESLGFVGTAKTKVVPDWIFGMDAPHRLAFLRGFLDADGSVDKNGRISYGSSNKDLLTQIRHLCMSCGIPVTNMRNQCGTTKLPNGKRFEYSFWVFTCSDPGANRAIGSHDYRYIERLKNGKAFNKKARNYPRYGGKGFENGSCELSRVSSITIEEAEPVYDLSVADTHNFIAEGVVVHNSNIEHQSIEFVTDSLMPWARRWEEEVNFKLLGEGNKFAKINMNAALRGDSKARAEFYYRMVTLGVMSINEVRELEDMNRIGTEGDEQILQLNQTTLKKLVSDEPVAEPFGAKPEEIAEEQQVPEARLIEAHRSLFEDAAIRSLRREANIIGKIVEDYAKPNMRESFELYLEKFYDTHKSYIYDTFKEPVRALVRLSNKRLNGSLGNTVDAVLDYYVEHHIDESKRLLLDAQGNAFSQSFWVESDRATNIADHVMKRAVDVGLLSTIKEVETSAHSETQSE
jgi:HK97 family phage portal protein